MAAVMLEKDKEKKKQEKEATLSERLPPLQLSGLSMQDLQVCAGHCVTPPSIPLMCTEGRARRAVHAAREDRWLHLSVHHYLPVLQYPAQT